MKIDTVEVRIGALAPPIAEQLRVANITYNAKKIKLLQSDADAITRLLIRGYISASVADAARQRLIRALTNQLTGEA